MSQYVRVGASLMRQMGYENLMPSGLLLTRFIRVTLLAGERTERKCCCTGRRAIHPFGGTY